MSFLLLLFGLLIVLVGFIVVVGVLSARVAALKRENAALKGNQSGAPVELQSPPLPHWDTMGSDAELLDLIRRNQKIRAIKLYRQRTGVGLKEAKDAVEVLERQHSPIPHRNIATDNGDYLELARRGQTIQAIKLYRQRTGVGLKEAKDAVEAMIERGR